MTFDLRLADVYALTPAAWLCLFADGTACLLDGSMVEPYPIDVLYTDFWLAVLDRIAPDWVYRVARAALRARPVAC